MFMKQPNSSIGFLEHVRSEVCRDLVVLSCLPWLRRMPLPAVGVNETQPVAKLRSKPFMYSLTMVNVKTFISK